MLKKCHGVSKYFILLDKIIREAREIYQNLSEEEKGKRRKKVRYRYKNLPEEKKEKLREFIKMYYLAHER